MSKKGIYAILLAGIFLFSAGASCMAEELAPGFDACTDKAQSTADNLECIERAFTYWDKILNENFTVARDACSEAENPKKCASDLLKAQRLWIQYKDAMAPVISELNGGGSLSRILANTFVARETRKQARLLSGQE